ncbi:MAG TPA: hypothetical protein VNG90_02135, partial [Candidatus Acidoferrum sp.]|nr:hypothetical protein [Candidatus Acidoferrum sp.]
MARGKQEDNLLDETMDQDQLVAAFLEDDDEQAGTVGMVEAEAMSPGAGDTWEDDAEASMPGQLAVDVYETEERLVVKARTAGV